MTWRERDHPRDSRGRFTDRSRWAARVAGKMDGDQRVEGRDLRGELDWEQLADHAPSPHEFTPGYGGDIGDGALHQIWQRQGFTGKPRQVDSEEMQRAIDSGWRSLWRGVNGSDTASPEEIAEKYRSGPVRAGLGAFGNGTYFAPDSARSDVTDFYGSAVIHAALSPQARTIDYNDLLEEMKRDGIDRHINTEDARWWVLMDTGRYASARGYDAILVTRYRGESDRFEPAEIVVLNRTATIVERVS